MAGERRILVVDDDRDIRGMLKLVLDSEGYDTALAADGSEALRAVATRAPDCVVLDVAMPGMDGHAVLRKIRSGATPRLPVVMMTAAGGDELVWQAWTQGVDYFMAKPFDPDELLRFLAVLFRNAAAS